MRGVISRRLVLALLLGAHIIGGWTLEGQQQPRPRTAAPPPPAEPFPSAGMVIAEVLFAPPQGTAPFVEIFNSGTAPVDVDTMVLRIGEGYLPLGHVTAPLAPNTRLLVLFDAGNRVDKNAVHAPKDITLPDTSGVIELLDFMGLPIDRVAWGQQPSAVPFGRSFPREEFPARGSTIGRPPTANRPSVFTEWVVYAPHDATPGTANPVPGIPLSNLTPISGAIFSGASVALAWFPATGVSRYRVQIDTAPSFPAPNVDRVVDEPAFSTTLAPGRYYWRIQPVVADASATFSPAASFRVDRSAGVARLWRATSGWLASTMRLGVWPDLGMRTYASVRRSTPALTTAAAAILQNPPVQLNVPHLMQRKDSLMLQLENPNATGTHAWNRVHSLAGSANDESDSWNCALANVAMVNRHYGGNLTQDRIGYEMLSRNVLNYRAMFTLPNGSIDPGWASMLNEVAPGPEWDLSYGNGISDVQIIAALAYSLNNLPRYEHSVATLDAMWTLITTEINERRPLITGFGNHTFTITGYQLFPGGGSVPDTRIIFTNDPLSQQGNEPHDLDAVPYEVWANFHFWMMPRGAVSPQRQEPGVTLDSDGDQVRDFDETERFFTDPHKRDSDSDGVDDFHDILSTVFEAEHHLGYGTTHAVGGRGRDFDQDGVPNERDPDSDDAGCKDGEEDENNTGMHERPESGNFDDTDDYCDGADGVIKFTTVISADFRDSPDPNKKVRTFSGVTARITFKLKRDPDNGPGQLVDDGSTYRAHTTGQVVISSAPDCAMFGREWTTGTGRFDRDGRSVGGVRSEDTLVVGADAETAGFSSANLCGIIVGSGSINGSWSTPPCLGHLDGSAPNVFLFNCTAPESPPPPNMRILVWTVYGHIRVR